MGKKLYVGNLSYTASEDGLRQLFSESGNVTSVSVVKNRDTGQSRGFGFVEMETDEGAQAAIAALNGADFMGRNLNISEAREGGGGGGGGGGGNRGPRRDFRGGGGGGGDRGGYGGGGGDRGGYGGGGGDRGGYGGGGGGDRGGRGGDRGGRDDRGGRGDRGGGSRRGGGDGGRY